MRTEIFATLEGRELVENTGLIGFGLSEAIPEPDEVITNVHSRIFHEIDCGTDIVTIEEKSITIETDRISFDLTPEFEWNGLVHLIMGVVNEEIRALEQ